MLVQALPDKDFGGKDFNRDIHQAILGSFIKNSFHIYANDIEQCNKLLQSQVPPSVLYKILGICICNKRSCICEDFGISISLIGMNSKNSTIQKTVEFAIFELLSDIYCTYYIKIKFYDNQ